MKSSNLAVTSRYFQSCTVTSRYFQSCTVTPHCATADQGPLQRTEGGAELRPALASARPHRRRPAPVRAPIIQALPVIHPTPSAFSPDPVASALARKGCALQGEGCALLPWCDRSPNLLRPTSALCGASVRRLLLQLGEPSSKAHQCSKCP